MAAKTWTEEENKFVRRNYQSMSNQELAKNFKVSPKSIEAKLRRLGLKRKKPTAVKKEVKSPSAARTEKLDRFSLHHNIRCRVCFLVDGYREKEEHCRFCGAKLFKQDIL
ncbi:hypothetical protein KAU86_05565 [bacterium]|nr:hypothetical protein [bacterium]MCK4325162.1 hypothetical protein [bacterium]MCK4437396.1 hypothetical protein [bacterium]